MRRWILILLTVCLFSGCSAGSVLEFETVRDVLPTCDAEDAPYLIRIALPEDAIPSVQTDTLCIWEAPDGDYETTTRVLVTDGLDAAVYALCGLGRTRIDLDGGRECRLVWSDDGAVYRALLRKEGDFCYVLLMRLRDGLGGEYRTVINELFSSFSLEPKEISGIRPARSPECRHTVPRTIRCRNSEPPQSPRRGSG